MNISLKGMLVGAIGAGAIASASAGLIPNGSFGFIPLGTVSYTGANLGAATSVTLPSLDVVNTVATSYQGNPTNLPITVGDFVHLSNDTLSAGTLPGWSISLIEAGDTLKFTETSFVKSSSAASNLSYYITGTFSDSLGDYVSGPASISLSFTQSGGTSGIVNGSGSVSVPPAATPEPASMLAMGFGVRGLVARRRARK